MRGTGALYKHFASNWAIALLAFASASCGHKPTLAELTEEFVYTTLSFSPSAATAAGLHEYKGLHLDGLLDDMGPAATSHELQFYRDFSQRLSKIDAEKLAPQDAADLAILQDQTGLALLDLTEIQTSMHNPAMYVETIGNALFTPYTVEYASKAERFRDIVSRLRNVPLLLDQAHANLARTPAVWCKAAIDENRGNIDLVDRELRNAAPPEIRSEYDRAAELALAALRKFQDDLTTKLQYLDNYDWRLGADVYNRKFRLTLESAGSAQDMLAAAEKEFAATRARMYDLALPIYTKLPSAQKDIDRLEPFERQNEVIGAVLTNISERHSTPESYMDDARKDLDEARAFVERTHLLALPPGANLQVIPTPEFERGVYSVGGFNPAPPLEPQLGAFYWITPIPPDWPKQRSESKLREYNFYKLKLLTLHEAIPGHYVQMQTASAIEPKSRRVLRSVYGSEAYVEGWAQYATEQMLDAGYLDHSPELALTFAKEKLRVILNAILDVRLHTLNMPDAEAMDAMQHAAFQEAEEAAGKLQRAKLTSCQLPAYYVGWSEWLKADARYRSERGAPPAEFRNKALKQGAVPMSQLVDTLTH